MDSSYIGTTWLERVQIRLVSESDLPALEWGGEYAHFRRLYSEIYHSTMQGKALMWVADLPEQGIVGQVFVQLSSSRAELADGSRRAYIYGFRIQSPFRGQGLGTRLLRVIELDLCRRGFRWATLNVGIDNPAARRLYERCGYNVIASEPGNWSYRDPEGKRHEVHEPAWRMEKRLFCD